MESDKFPKNEFTAGIFLAIDPLTFKAEEYFQDLEKKLILNVPEHEMFTLMSRFRLPVKESIDHMEYCSSLLYYDWDGSKIHFWEWAFKNEYLNRHVAKDFLHGHLVSTVWIGMNLRHRDPPLIYETMIFKDDDSLTDIELLDDYMERYPTYQEALEGHKRACDEVRKQYEKEKP